MIAVRELIDSCLSVAPKGVSPYVDGKLRLLAERARKEIEHIEDRYPKEPDTTPPRPKILGGDE